MKWLNLIWIIPVGLFYTAFVLTVALVFFHQRYRYRQVRKIHEKLYGEVNNVCVLCPKCRGFIYIGVWEEHLDRNHGHVHYVKSLDEEFVEAAKKL